MKLTTSLLLEKFAEEIQVATALRKTRRISDGQGLLLVIRPNGSASWVLRYTFRHKSTDFTVGHWPHMSLEAARTKAQQSRDVIASGESPAAQRAAERWKCSNAPALGTVEAAFRRWLEMDKSHLSKNYQSNIESSLAKHVLPVLGSRQLREVTIGDVMDISRAVESLGALEMRRCVRMWLSQMFEFAAIDQTRDVSNDSLDCDATLSSQHLTAKYEMQTFVLDQPSSHVEN